MANAIQSYRAMLEHEIYGRPLTRDESAGVLLEIHRLQGKRRNTREKMLLSKYEAAINGDRGIERTK